MQTLFGNAARGAYDRRQPRAPRRFRLIASSGLLTLAVIAYLIAAGQRATRRAESEADLIRQFLSEGRFDSAYDAADDAFKLGIQRQDFTSYVLRSRRDLGSCDGTRMPRTAVSQSSLQGTRVWLEYRSPCERGTLVESFTLVVDRKECRLLRYYARDEP
jgi:hypothetical protein